MKTLFSRSLAVLVSGSLLLDPGFAAAVTLTPQPATVHFSNRFSENALNDLAVWQHFTPTPLLKRIRNHLTIAATALSGLGAVAKGVALAMTQHAAPIAHIMRKTIQTVTIHVPVSVYNGDSQWSLARRWLGTGTRYKEIPGNLHPGQINLFDIHTVANHAPVIHMVQQPLLWWQHLFVLFSSPEALILLLAGTVLTIVAGVLIYKKWKQSKASVATATPQTAELTPRRARTLWRHPLLRPVMAGVQVLLILTNSFAGFGAVKTIQDLFKASTDQVEQSVDLKNKTTDAKTKLSKHTPKAVLGIQTIFEKYGGTPDLFKFAGPSVSIPNIPLPHTDPMAAADNLAMEREPEQQAAQKRKALRDYLDVLTPITATYAEKSAYVEALTRQLDKVTDVDQKTTLNDALGLAKNQKNEALNTLKETLKLPQSVLGADEDVSIPTADKTVLKELNADINKSDLLASDADPEALLIEIDAHENAKKVSALSHIRWWDRLPGGFSTTLSFNLLDLGFPHVGALSLLANSGFNLPHFDTLDPVKDKQTIDQGKASLIATKASAQSRLEQAFQDWKAASVAPAAEADPTLAAQAEASTILRRWNALSDMNHFGVTPEKMDAWLALSDADRATEISTFINQRFVGALPALESWLNAITENTPAPSDTPVTENKEPALQRVSVDAPTEGMAWATNEVPAYNGQAQIEKGFTGAISTNVKFLRHTKKIAAIKKIQQEAQDRLDKKDIPENSVKYARLNYLLFVTAQRLAEETRDPIVFNPGLQQSHHDTYAWVYYDVKAVLTKGASGLFHLVVHPKTPEGVAASIKEAQANFQDNLKKTIRQVQIDKEATDDNFHLAQQSLTDLKNAPLPDKEAITNAETALKEASDAYDAAAKTYGDWETYALTKHDGDEFAAAYFKHTIEYYSDGQVKTVAHGLWDDKATPTVDSADYDVRAALRHEKLLEGDTPSTPTGASWDANVFTAVFFNTLNFGKLQDAADAGTNLITNYDPAARGTVKDKRTEDLQKAHAATIIAEQNAAFARAQTYSQISAAVTEADRLNELATKAGIAGTPLQSQILSYSRQAQARANQLTQKAALHRRDAKPLDRNSMFVLHVPDAKALAKALSDVQKTPAAVTYKTPLIKRVLGKLNVPVSGVHFLQIFGPVKAVGTQETFGAVNVEDLPGFNKTSKRLSGNKDDAVANEKKLAGSMSEQEIFYKAKRLVETLHGRESDGHVIVPGLISLSTLAAERADNSYRELDRAIESKQDAANIYVRFQSYRKNAALYDQMLSQIATADAALRTLILTLSPETIKSLGITQEALPAIADNIVAARIGPVETPSGAITVVPDEATPAPPDTASRTGIDDNQGGNRIGDEPIAPHITAAAPAITDRPEQTQADAPQTRKERRAADPEIQKRAREAQRLRDEAQQRLAEQKNAAIAAVRTDLANAEDLFFNNQKAELLIQLLAGARAKTDQTRDDIFKTIETHFATIDSKLPNIGRRVTQINGLTQAECATLIHELNQSRAQRKQQVIEATEKRIGPLYPVKKKTTILDRLFETSNLLGLFMGSIFLFLGLYLRKKQAVSIGVAPKEKAPNIWYRLFFGQENKDRNELVNQAVMD